jgi:hypothetical protein
MFLAFTRAADPATARPRVNAVSAGWPRRSATTAAHKVSTGARLISRGMASAKPEAGALARDGILAGRAAPADRDVQYRTNLKSLVELMRPNTIQEIE